MEALRGAVGAHPPLGIRRRWGALDADRFDAGLADIPGFAAVVGLEEFVAVAGRAGTMIDHQRPALPILEKELLDGSETGLIEDLMWAPGPPAVGSHQQEWVLRERGKGEAASPARFDVGELYVVETRAAHALVDLAPGPAVVLAAQQHGVECGGGGVDVARGENPERRRFHCRQLQVDRAGILPSILSGSTT